MYGILIIEDDDEIRGLIQSILEFDYNILATRSLEEAELVWAENKSQIDIVLSDLCLPEAISTISCVSRWQAERPGLQTIFISGLSVAGVESEHGLINGIDFLAKPFTVSELRMIVTDAAVRFETVQVRAA
jgi:DNA-binding NtrC family response regulator